MKLKKLVLFVFSMFLVISCGIKVDAQSFNANNKGVIIEELSYDELINEPEVLNYLNGFGGIDRLENDKLEVKKEVIREYNSYIRNDTVDRINKSIGIISENKIDVPRLKELEKKYNVDIPEPKVNCESKYIVERDFKTRSVGNIWVLNYLVTDKSFSIVVINIGIDPLDSVTGTIKLYGKSKKSWSYKDKASVSKYQVGNGNVKTWIKAKKYVKEKFEYDLTVVEDGTVWKYDNKGDDDRFRYNFAHGPYNKLDANGGERHHFVSKKALDTTGYDSKTAYAIRMIYEDHKLTGSWGSSNLAKDYRDEEIKLLKNGDFEELLQKEVDDLKAKDDPDGEYNNLQQKYYDAVIYSLYEYEQLFGV